jgi:hypothetical protein
MFALCFALCDGIESYEAETLDLQNQHVVK